MWAKFTDLCISALCWMALLLDGSFSQLWLTSCIWEYIKTIHGTTDRPQPHSFKNILYCYSTQSILWIETCTNFKAESFLKCVPGRMQWWVVPWTIHYNIWGPLENSGPPWTYTTATQPIACSPPSNYLHLNGRRYSYSCNALALVYKRTPIDILSTCNMNSGHYESLDSQQHYIKTPSILTKYIITVLVTTKMSTTKWMHY